LAFLVSVVLSFYSGKAVFNKSFVENAIGVLFAGSAEVDLREEVYYLVVDLVLVW